MIALAVTDLTCEYHRTLLGTDCKRPRLAWKLVSDRRGTLQTAYRIQVAEADAGLAAPLWDTGRVESDRSIQVPYAGPALRSRTRYLWRVKVWDNFGRESDWSEPAWWETALLSPVEWKAQWITPDARAIDPESEPAFLLRKRFTLRGPVRSARIYATAAGLYELYLNGRPVSDHVLAPGWTSYRRRHQYQTYDVTAVLHAGENALGVLLGDGWYKGRLTWVPGRKNIYGDRRAALVQLHVYYEDGTEEVIVSDPTWKAATGPILFASIYDGEVYDARLEQPDWSEAGFDDRNWAPTEALALPLEHLVAQENWPTRVTEVIRPQQVLRTPAGDTVVDMGQNMVGRVRLTVDVPAGTRIRLQHAEVLDREGNFYTGNLRTAKQTVEYVARGGGPESYAPHFTFMGFRYVKVEGLPVQDPSALLDCIAGEVIHSDMERTGAFECSHPLVNQLQRNIVWGQRGNFVDVPTDCPQRDERLGWTGDAQVFVRTAAFNYHVGPFFTKWLRDLRADQRPDGSVPFVVPNPLDDYHDPNWKGDGPPTSAAWGDAATICPWALYLCYGDERLLAEQYDSMKAWVEFIRAQGEDEYLWNTGFHFGDWLGLDAKENNYVGATPIDLIATAFYAYSTRILRDAAVVLGKAEDVRTYSELLHCIQNRFREEFLTPRGRLAAPTQTAHVLALMFGLVEGEARERTARELNRLVVENNYHLTTGFVGTPYLCAVLSDNGYHETAVRLLLQEEYPGWLYPITRGATTIWEHWDSIKPDGSFWSDDMNSFNHYAYGAIGDWLYRYLAGLDMDERAPAYKRIRIYPRLGAGLLTHACATLESPYGRIETAWRLEGELLTVAVQVPANTTAEVILPGASLEALRESGQPLGAVEGVHTAEQVPEGVRLTVGSGAYRFTYPFCQTGPATPIDRKFR